MLWLETSPYTYDKRRWVVGLAAFVFGQGLVGAVASGWPHPDDLQQVHVLSPNSRY